MKTEFGGEIGDGIFDRAAGTGFSIGIVASEISLELFKDLLELAQKIFVLREFFQTRLARKLEHADRVVICAIPQLGVEVPEEPARGGLPRPPKIKAHLPERLQRRWQDGRHIVSLESRHSNARCCSRGR